MAATKWKDPEREIWKENKVGEEEIWKEKYGEIWKEIGKEIWKEIWKENKVGVKIKNQNQKMKKIRGSWESKDKGVKVWEKLRNVVRSKLDSVGAGLWYYGKLRNGTVVV